MNVAGEVIKLEDGPWVVTNSETIGFSHRIIVLKLNITEEEVLNLNEVPDKTMIDYEFSSKTFYQGSEDVDNLLINPIVLLKRTFIFKKNLPA